MVSAEDERQFPNPYVRQTKEEAVTGGTHMLVYIIMYADIKK